MSMERTFEGAEDNSALIKSTNEMLQSASERAVAERVEQTALRADQLQTYREAEARGEWVPDWARAATQKSAEAFTATRTNQV